MLNIAERSAAQQQREQRSAELARRDKEYGGLTPYDRETEEKQRSASGWGPYKLETTKQDLTSARAGIDPRSVSVKRLWIDCGLGVRRWAKWAKRETADTLRTDALLLLLRWEQHGGGARKDGTRTPILNLGGKDGTPQRRDWIETVERADGTREQQLTPRAWAALHAAVKQAAEAPSFLALAPEEEESTDPLDIAAAVEAQQRDAGNVTRYPDSTAPDIIARAMNITLDSARAIIAADEQIGLAEQWHVSEQSARNAISRGKRALRETFPTSASLLDALDTAAAAWRAESESSAILALIDFRDGYRDETSTRVAVDDWRSKIAALPMERRAILAAARSAEQRNGHHYGGARAELIALSVGRIMAAETQRARSSSAAAARSSHLPGTQPSASTQRLSARQAPAPPAAPRPIKGQTRWSRYGSGYSGACTLPRASRTKVGAIDCR